MQSVQQVDEGRSYGIPPELERMTRSRKGVWIASLVALLGQIVFVALFNFALPPFDEQLSGFQLGLVGALLSLVPALLWLLVFYQMDRLEPEPKEGVIKIAILAALIYAAVAAPLLNGLFDVKAWLYDAWWTQLLGGILVIGVIQTAVTYATVRYGVYFNEEFDERVDGIIYATAAGLGLATVLNFIYVFEHGGVNLDVGSIRMVVNALAYGSFGGILGYFLGQTRFEKTPWYYLPSGVLLVAILNGLFFFVEDRVTATGLQTSPLNGLIWAAVFATISFGIVFWLVQRANEETLRLAKRRKEGATPAVAEVEPPPSSYAPPLPASEPDLDYEPAEEPETPPSLPLEPEVLAPEIPLAETEPSDAESDFSEDLDEAEKQEILEELRSSWQALVAEEETPGPGEDQEPFAEADDQPREDS